MFGPIGFPSWLLTYSMRYLGWPGSGGAPGYLLGWLAREVKKTKKKSIFLPLMSSLSQVSLEKAIFIGFLPISLSLWDNLTGHGDWQVHKGF